MKFVYDNSDGNVRNPNDPPQRVVAGNRAVDEMAHLWVQVLPEDPAQAKRDPERKFWKPWRGTIYKRIRKISRRITIWRFADGAGESAEAIAHFAAANRIRPTSQR